MLQSTIHSQVQSNHGCFRATAFCKVIRNMQMKPGSTNRKRTTTHYLSEDQERLDFAQRNRTFLCLRENTVKLSGMTSSLVEIKPVSTTSLVITSAQSMRAIKYQTASFNAGTEMFLKHLFALWREARDMARNALDACVSIAQPPAYL